MAAVNRPLSPHLTVYKLPLTALLSITHRGTGVFLTLGCLFLSCWLLSVANGPEAFSSLQVHVNAWYGQILLLAWAFSLFFHLCNGIRHLFWDIGLGLEKESSNRSSFVVLATSIVLTIISALLARGGL